MLRTVYYFKDGGFSLKEYAQGRPAQALSMEYNSMVYDFLIIEEGITTNNSKYWHK